VKLAFQKLASNIMFWLIFIVIFVGMYIYDNDLKLNEVVPSKELVHLADYRILGYQVLSGLFLFSIYALASHKSRTKEDKEKGTLFVDIALNDFAGVLFNFGSLNLSLAIFMQDSSMLVITGVAYIVGLIAYPKGK